MWTPWYTFNYATEGIGSEYPQHQEMGSDYNYASPESVHNLPFDKLPDFEPNFSTIVIHTNAKLTDLLSSSPIRKTGFLVSSRLRKLLEQFTLPLHRFYPVPMTHRGRRISGYYWIQLPQPQIPLTENMSIAAAEKVIAEIPEIAMLDLLRLDRPARFAYCFVSHRLRQAMEVSEITGVRFGTSKLFRYSKP